MIYDIGYSRVLLSRAMGLPTTSHLEKWMVLFIETIRMGKMSLDWAMILSDNMDEN